VESFQDERREFAVFAIFSVINDAPVLDGALIIATDVLKKEDQLLGLGRMSGAHGRGRRRLREGGSDFDEYGEKHPDAFAQERLCRAFHDHRGGAYVERSTRRYPHDLRPENIQFSASIFPGWGGPLTICSTPYQHVRNL
jgi:hypothetical protein